MTDISNIDKVALLKALWDNQKPAAFFSSGPGPTFANDKASAAIDHGYIDYFCGRAIRADLKGSTADFSLYDRDAPVSGAKVVAALQKSGSTPKKEKAGNKGCDFEPFGEPMLEGKSHTVMCAKCGYFKSQH